MWVQPYSAMGHGLSSASAMPNYTGGAVPYSIRTPDGIRSLAQARAIGIFWVLFFFSFHPGSGWNLTKESIFSATWRQRRLHLSPFPQHILNFPLFHPDSGWNYNECLQHAPSLHSYSATRSSSPQSSPSLLRRSSSTSYSIRTPDGISSGL